MLDRVMTFLGTTVMVAIAYGPAFAQPVCEINCISVPEPGTMTLFAAGAAGAFLVRKLIRRK